MFFDQRFVFSKEVFDILAKTFSFVISKKSLVPLLSGIAKSISEFKIGNFPTSIVLSWFVVESVLIEKWMTFLEVKNTSHNGKKRIDSDLRKKLLGRDYTISTISNILELTDIIPFAIFEKVDRVRHYRNNVVHGDMNYECKPEHCVQAIQLAIELALDEQPFTIEPNLALKLTG